MVLLLMLACMLTSLNNASVLGTGNSCQHPRLIAVTPVVAVLQGLLAHEHYSLLYRVQTINPSGNFYTLRILLSAADVGLQVRG